MLFVLYFLFCFAPPEVSLTPVGAVRHPAIREASGFVKSRQHPDLFWVVNDSGNAADLYAIRKTGELLATYKVAGAVNLDWEAMAVDNDGNLYIGDVGNNAIRGGIARRWVYRVREPDPTSSATDPRIDDTLTVAVETTYFYTFPEKAFDIEGMFFHEKDLYLVKKIKATKSGGTALYRLTLNKTGEVTELVEVSKIRGASVVTGASLSDDGRRLVLCSYNHLSLLTLGENQPLADLYKIAPRFVHYRSTDIEACCWDNDRVLLIGESGSIHGFDAGPLKMGTNSNGK